MSTASGALAITRSAVFRDRRRVADLRYSGDCIVVVEAGILPRRLGRIWPAGYLSGERNPGILHDAWTAKHPMVHTPSDTIIAESLPLAECIAVILGRSAP